MPARLSRLADLLGSVLLIGMATTSAPAGAQGEGTPVTADTLSVGPVKYELEARRKIGEKRAGLLCLPNGSLNFQQLILPVADSLVDDITRELVSMGVTASGDDPIAFNDRAARYRALPTVIDMQMSVCAKRWGLGDASILKGKAIITLRWDVYERPTRSLVGSLTLQGSFDGGSKSLVAGDLIRGAIINAISQIPSTAEGRTLLQLN